MFEIELTADTAEIELTSQSSGVVYWGTICGNLSAQTDLMAVLNAKANITYVDEQLATKANIATTLAGYGITDAKIEGGVITLGSNTITPITSHQDISGKADTTYVNTQLATKQNTLTAGSNVQINNNVISATDTTYTAGTGISIVDNVISNTQTSAEWGNITGTLSAQTDLMTALNGKQATLIAGTNITIVDNVISATGGGGSATWGSIGGTLSEQTDLQTALNGKQATLPTTSTAGKVLTSTDTQGVVQWGDGGGYVLPEATTTTLGGVIIGNGLNINSGVVSVPSMELDTERSFALPDSIAVPLKAEIKAEVNAGVVTTIGTVMSTDPTVMSKIIKATPLSTGTLEFLEVNND